MRAGLALVRYRHHGPGLRPVPAVSRGLWTHSDGEGPMSRYVNRHKKTRRHRYAPRDRHDQRLARAAGEPYLDDSFAQEAGADLERTLRDPRINPLHPANLADHLGDG